MTFSDQVKQIEVQIQDMRDRPNRDHRMLNLCQLLLKLICELESRVKMSKTSERRKSGMAGKTKPKAATGSGKAKAKAAGGKKK